MRPVLSRPEQHWRALRLGGRQQNQGRQNSLRWPGSIRWRATSFVQTLNQATVEPPHVLLRTPGVGRDQVGTSTVHAVDVRVELRFTCGHRARITIFAYDSVVILLMAVPCVPDGAASWKITPKRVSVPMVLRKV